jgi:hypothetical protein
MHEKLTALSSFLQGMENSMRAKAQGLRENPAVQDESALEKALAIPVARKRLDCSICAVDSGFAMRAFHGVDVVLVKSAAVNFFYRDSKLVAYDYLPSAFPEITLEFMVGLDEHENALFKSLVRLRQEISLAVESVEKFSPECMLIDGSLLPLAGDVPKKDSALFPLYGEVIGLYRKLYQLCEEKKISLFGVIKDSRSRRFVDIAKIENANDSVFLNYLLKKGERTFAMRYATANSHATPVMKDLEPFSSMLCAFYMKASEDAFPLRIEFFNGGNIDAMAEKIYSICAVNESYAYPAPLIEADLCAALGNDEVDNVFAADARSAIKPLRRDSRPFR